MRIAAAAAVFALGIAAVGSAVASPQPKDSGATAARLQQLRTEIAKLQSQETYEIKRKHRVQAELRRLEKRIGRLSRELTHLSQREAKLSGRRHALQDQTAQSRDAARTARQRLAAALRAAFILGREPQIQLALKGNDPSTAARLLGYYGYYSQARSAHIKTLTATIRHYETLENELAATSEQLKRTEATRRISLTKLKQARHNRETVVARLSRDIASKHARAADLRRDAERLERVIRSVNTDLADVPAKVLDNVDFSKLRGRLQWPVNGHIIDRFGAPRANGQLRWEAVRIAAPAGTRVRAIAYGRVAYAGWLPYYGLVLMVDHGNGYLTVYGHNEALYKQVGDWVEAGDVLATVGTSGGQSKPVLYFQIRHTDHPLNPERWCMHGHPAKH